MRIMDPQVAVEERELSRRTAAEYKAEIVEHIIAMDQATRPDVTMIDMQPEIQWRMWPYLIDFLVDVHQKLQLQPSTFFLAMNIVNRYCARRIVFRKHFQLVGCTALWIASKYEDKKSRVPTLAVLNHMCCKAYQEELFVQMEGHVLNTLDWTISHCSVDTFLNVCLSHGSSPLLHSLCSYLAELTLYHHDFVCADPYMVARTIHLLALHILSFYPSLNSQSLSPEEARILELLGEAIRHPSRALADKYGSMDRFQVSKLVANHVARQELQCQGSPTTMENPATLAPLTPPQTIGRNSNFTPPYLSSGSTSSLSSRFPAEDSPYTVHSQDGSLSGIVNLKMSSSPPTTPLDPPKRPFTGIQI